MVETSPHAALRAMPMSNSVRLRRRSAFEEALFLEHDEFAATCICMANHGLLDRQRMKFYDDSTRSALRDSVLFCSRPTVALYSKWLYPAILLLIATMILSGVYHNIVLFGSSQVKTSSVFRFTPISFRHQLVASAEKPLPWRSLLHLLFQTARDEEAEAVWDALQTSYASEETELSSKRAALLKFGLLKSGSPLQIQAISEHSDGSAYTITFAVPVKMDGFFFVTNLRNASMDPMSFVVDAQTADGAWVQVASSTSQAGHTDTTPGPYPVPDQRGAMVFYDLRPRTWGWIHLNITNPLLIGTYLFAISLIGMCTYRQDLIHPIICAVYSLNTLLWFAATLDSDYNISHFAAAATVTYGAAAATICTGERYLWLFILEIGGGMTLSGLYGRYMLWQGAKLSEAPSILLCYGAVILSVLFYSAASYVCICAEARKLVEEDKEKYDDNWKKLTSTKEQCDELKELEASVQELIPGGEGGLALGYEAPLRQHSRKFVATDEFIRRPFKFFKASREECVETSLSHLFLFARYLHPLLIDKVKGWASQSNGLFRLKLAHVGHQGEQSGQGQDQLEKGRKGGTGTVAGELCQPSTPAEGAGGGGAEWVEWGKVDEGATQRVRFAKLKLPSRAVAKTVRSYGGDVSRLVDICRQSIVFESVRDMKTCVEAIASDTDVEVKRVKNRMALSYESKATGYRDVNINLSIVNESTQRIGADMHICEVQLILRQVAALRNDKGHEHYVAFRNYKSE